MSDQQDKPQELAFTDAGGKEVLLRGRFGPDRTPSADSAVRLRSVRLVEPWHGIEPSGITELLQKRIVMVPGGRLDWSRYDGLDREISIGLRLSRGYVAPGREYPPELARLVGYDVDAPEPFAVFLPYRGEPLKGLARRFLLPDQQAVESGLFRALHQLAALGIVHRAISPDTVLWDAGSSRVQVVDYSHAVVARAGGGDGAVAESPWLCPADVRRVDPRVDVWSAGAVIYYVVADRRIGDGDPLTDPALRNSDLHRHLVRILADSVDSRPAAREVLGALRPHDNPQEPLQAVDAPEESFQRGAEQFDAIFSARREATARLAATESAPEPAAGTLSAPRGPARAHRARRRGPWPFGTIAFAASLALALLGIGAR